MRAEGPWDLPSAFFLRLVHFLLAFPGAVLLKTAAQATKEACATEDNA